MLNPDSLPAFQSALADARVDGWLLFDFRGVNPVANASEATDMDAAAERDAPRIDGDHAAPCVDTGSGFPL